jgi:hypothetical protein
MATWHINFSHTSWKWVRVFGRAVVDELQKSASNLFDSGMHVMLAREYLEGHYTTFYRNAFSTGQYIS